MARWPATARRGRRTRDGQIGKDGRIIRRIIVGAGLIVAGPAAADGVPPLDARPACLARTATAADLARCLRREEDVRQRLLARWNVLPDFRKHFCEQSVAFQRPDRQSYSNLLACLDDPASS